MATLPYDSKTRQVGPHRVEVKILEREIRGLVDGNEVFGVYIDDPARLRTSSASAPTGSFAKVQATITCMSMVCESVREYVEAQRADREVAGG